MKNIFKISLSLLGLVIIGLYLTKSLSSSNKKFSNFKSYQKELKLPTTSPKMSKVEDKTSPSTVQKINTKRVIANKFKFENSVVSFLDKKSNGWSWSPDVFVVKDGNYLGSIKNIIGNYDGFIVVKDSNKPTNALTLVYNSTEKRLGIFTNKIIVIHSKSSDFESKVRQISGTDIQYVSGAYFILTNDFEHAINTISSMQTSFKNVKMDLDVNSDVQKAN